MKDLNTLLNQLPGSWNDVSLGMFQKLSSTRIREINDDFDGIENTLAVISKLTDTSIEDLEEMAMKDLQQLGSKLSFMVDLPARTKASVKEWKTPEEISYNDYVTFIKIEPDKQLENLGLFVKNFSKTKLTQDEIEALSLPDVLTGFFLQRKALIKSMKRLMKSAKLTGEKKAKAEKKHQV